jgi:hypothetical protein
MAFTLSFCFVFVFCCFFFYLFSYIVLIFTYLFFILCSSALISFSVTSYLSFTPHFSPGVCCLCTWHFYHWVELDNVFPPPVVFWIICLLIKYCTFSPFPSSNFAHVSILLCITIRPVRLSSIMECLSPKLHWLPSTMLPSVRTTWINPVRWHHATEKFSPLILHPI